MCLGVNGKRNIAGTAEIDLGEMFKRPGSKAFVSELSQCSDRTARVEFRVRATFVSEMDLPEGN